MSSDKKLKESFAISGDVMSKLEAQASTLKVSKSAIVEYVLRQHLNMSTDQSPQILATAAIKR